MNNEIDPYLSLLRIAEMVKQQREELAECKAQLSDISAKFDKFKSILTQIDGMTDTLMDAPDDDPLVYVEQI